MAITYKTVLAEAIRGYNNIQDTLHNFNATQAGVLTYDGTNAVNKIDSTTTANLVKGSLTPAQLTSAISRLAVINTDNTTNNAVSENGKNITGVVAYRGSDITDNDALTVGGTTKITASYSHEIAPGYYPEGVEVSGSKELNLGAATYTVSAGNDQSFTPTISKITDDGSSSGVNIQAATGTISTSEPISGYYVAVQSSSNSKTVTAKAQITKSGYIAADSGKTDNAIVTINKSLVTYVPVNAATFTAATGTATFTESTDTITGNTNIAGKAAISSTKPADNANKYFYKFTSSGSATVNSDKAGYIPASTATAATTISGTGYVTIDAGSATVSGGGLSGGGDITPSLSISSTKSNNIKKTISEVDDAPSTGYYLKVDATSGTGSKTVSRAKVTLTKTEGYISAGTTDPVAADSKTVNVKANTDTKYLVLPSATLGNTATTDVTYTDYSTVNSNFQLVADDKYLYLDEGYMPATKISLGQLIPDIDKDATASWIYNGYKAYAEDGTLLVGTMPDGSCTVAGGGLSVTSNYTGTPTVTIANASDTNMENITLTNNNGTKADTTTYPYYFKIKASTAKLTGSTTVSRAAITDTHTAGYISAKSATTVISATTSSPSVTVNAASDNEYIGMKKAGFTSNGGTASLTVSENANAINSSVSTAKNISSVIAAPTTSTPTAAGYYYSFNVSSSGSGTVTTSSAGYIPASETVGTVSVSKSATRYYSKINAATLSASATASASLTVAPGTVSIAKDTSSIEGKTRLDITPVTDSSQISSDFYLAVKATAAANTIGTSANITGTASAGTTASGYAESNVTTASGSVSGTATATTSSKSSDVYYIPIGEATVTNSTCSAKTSSSAASNKGLAKTTTSTTNYVYTRVECTAGTVSSGYIGSNTTIGHTGNHDIKIPAKSGGAISVNTATVSGSTTFDSSKTGGIDTASSKTATASSASLETKDFYMLSNVTAASKGAIGADNTGTNVDAILGAAWLRLNGADYTDFTADDTTIKTTSAYTNS